LEKGRYFTRWPSELAANLEAVQKGLGEGNNSRASQTAATGQRSAGDILGGASRPIAENSRARTYRSQEIRCIAIEDQHCNRTIQIYFAASCAEIPKYAAALILITVPHPASGEQSFRLPP
jgi:hypothetical protein